MPNRILREGFLDSEAIHQLSDAAECFYHRLLLAADDAGRFDGRTEILRARLFPLDSSRRASDVEKQLRECRECGLVVAYEWSGKPYLQVVKWQRCGSATTSRFPWRDGSHTISYVSRETRDGDKDFASSSLQIEGVNTPCAPPADGVAVDSNTETETETETETITKTKTGIGSGSFEGLPPELDSPQFREAWGRYASFRAKRKFAALLPESVGAQWRRLAKYGDAIAIEAIEQTIANGWQGLFPEKINPKEAKPTEKPFRIV